ncbi:MAG: FkbM family methyltransferase [Acidobacteria bacterium]|nr:FkbM family methyltransferase [Acidobacteriota bacterium]
MASLSDRLRLLRWMSHYYRPEHTVTVNTANGLLSVSSSDWLIGKILFTRGGFEIDFIRHSVELLAKLGRLRPSGNRIVVDVGANIGMISTAMLLQGYFRRAIAFEPSPRNFNLLKRNIEQNELGERVDAFDIALSSADGTADFEISPDNSGDSRVRVVADEGKMGEARRKSVSVAVRSFDSFLAEHSENANDIDLVWIDVQGHEGHFFEGAAEFFRGRDVPVVSEFWAYGIGRAGMDRERYCNVVSHLFSRFFVHEKGGFTEHDIDEIGRLFDKYRGPRQGTNIILVK